MKRLLVIALTAVFISLLVKIGGAQSTLSYGSVQTSLSTSSTGAVTGTAFTLPSSYANIVSWQTVANGSGLTAILEASNDNSSWSTVDTSSAATGEVRNYGFSATKFIRCSQSARTGGTSTTCTIVANRGFITGSGSGNLSTLTLADGSVTSPSLVWAGPVGFYRIASQNLLLTNNSVNYHMWGVNLYRVGSGTTIGFSPNASPALANEDLKLTRGTTGTLVIGDGSNINGALFLGATAFASLGTPSNGTMRYCSDCTIANPCAGAGTGALAKRLNGVWVCN